MTPVSSTPTPTSTSSATIQPSSTPKSSQNPTKHPTKTSSTTATNKAITINPVCSDNDLIVCPDGKCKLRVANCEGVPDTDNNKLQDVSFEVSKHYRNKNLRVNLLNKRDGGGFGDLVFPANIFREGWNVTIRQSYQEQSSSDNGCGNDKSSKTGSIAVDIEVTKSNGDRVNHFDKSFTLSLFGILGAGTESTCLGYRSNERDDWNCDDKQDTNVQSIKTESVFGVESQFDHLTSFAVLLGGSTPGECAGWGWIEYASMGMIGGAILLTIISILLHCCSYQFRVLVSGSDEKKAMELINKAQAKGTEISALTNTNKDS